MEVYLLTCVCVCVCMQRTLEDYMHQLESKDTLMSHMTSQMHAKDQQLTALMDLLTDENNKVRMVDCCLCQPPPASESCDPLVIDRFRFLRGPVSARHSVWAPYWTWLKSAPPVG